MRKMENLVHPPLDSHDTPILQDSFFSFLYYRK